MSGTVSVGSRLPALHTSMGRIQLGFLDDSEIWRRLGSARIEPLTPYTILDRQSLFDRIKADHEQGFSLVDEELERGLRSLAVPIADREGQAIAALNLSTHASRTTRNEMRDRFLPELRALAAQVSLFVG
jgi:IclR family pca regulon transcriptional regulator